MNKLSLLTIALLSILSGVGCHSSSGTSSTKSEVTVNGKSQEDYYAQFIQSEKFDCQNKTGTNTSIETFYFRQETNPLGIAMRAVFDLDLNEDHTFFLTHFSLNRDLKTNTILQKESKNYDGAWKLENGVIYLENIGHGTGVMYNDQPAINFTFDNDLSGQPLKDKSVLIFSQQREISPEDVAAKCSK